MRTVITSLWVATSRMVLVILLLGDRVERRGGLVEDEQARAAQQGAGDGQASALPTRDLHPAFADDRIQALLRPGEEGVAGRALQGVETLRVGRVRPHELEIFRMVPEKSCVSWVTKPIWERRCESSTSLPSCPLYRIRPFSGW